MAKIPHTQKHIRQYRGPSDSEQFNQTSEDIFRDLVYLHNKANEVSSDIREGFSAAAKNIDGISREIEDLKAELSAAKTAVGAKVISYTGSEMDDSDRFNLTAYDIPAVERLTFDARFRTVSLPKIIESSMSRLKYADVEGDISVPPSLEMVVVPDSNSIDDAIDTANLRTSLPQEAVIAEPGKVWERNILSTSPNGQVTMDLIVKLPTELTATDLCNTIDLVPFPAYGVDVLGIYYNLDSSPSLTTDSAGWIPLNNDDKYVNNSAAVGKVPPGAWANDEINTAGPLSFIFNSKKITAFKITLRQRNPFDVSSQYASARYVYSYGLSYLDVRYDKFETEGRAIFKLEPNTGDTISSVESVTPHIYNVAQAGLEDVFSYRVIWETAPDSGTYTLTEVPLSEKVWLEVTLQKDSLGNMPALTGFKVEYS